MARVQVILNPYAGRGKGAKSRDKIEELLSQTEIDFSISETAVQGHGITLAKEAKLAGYDYVVAAGGDGTISEVINGLSQATDSDEIVGTLGIIPIGTGNDFADMLQIPRQLGSAILAFKKGLIEKQTQLIDYGLVEIKTQDDFYQRYFNNNVGIGLEAEVTLESYKIKRLRGTALYVLAALRTLRRYTPPQIKIYWTDRQRHIQNLSQPTTLISIGNGARTGGGFYLTPHAQVDDGWLDVAIADALSPFQALLLLPRALRGNHTDDPHVTMSHCRKIGVTSQVGLPIHIDGEVITSDATQIDISILPQRLKIVTA